MTVGVGLFFALIFGAAGRLDWTAGWTFLAFLAACHGLSTLVLWIRNPELFRLRGRVGEGTKQWDKVWLALFGCLYMAILVVAALDAGRFKASEMPAWAWPVGAGLYALFVTGITWAMAVNPHFEKTVRIQRDRNHRVVDSGPYRIVRHPGYTFLILGFIPGTPLMLASWWAFVPASLAVVWVVVRTILEDRTLQDELAGYPDYALRVRYRLVPGVW